jgi:hypothetical protein
MTIRFLYGRREALTGKSEAYKKSVRAYLESFGFSQTTDSIVEGTFEDMVFYNPTIDPGKRFVIETKAESLSLKSKKFARELAKYFRLWQNQDRSERFKFMLFAQAVKKPSEWELIFSETRNLPAVIRWCRWFNKTCLDLDEALIAPRDRTDVAKFFADSIIVVGNNVQLEIAVSEKKMQSVSSINRMAKNLLNIVNKRKTPIAEKSTIIMNIFPVNVPECYYTCPSKARDKKEIYDSLKDKLIPPFIWRKDRSMMSFSRFDESNSLSEFAEGSTKSRNTKELQIENPTLASRLVNIHLRRILWNKGVYRDKEIFYFPMLDKSEDKRLELDHRGVKRWVTKKMVHIKDTKYARKGDINFFFHRAVELKTPTYWGTSYIELTPRKYYTLDGETPIEGKIRAKIDAKFRTPYYDRGKSRIRLMKLWKFVLFESKEFRFEPEEWFDKFQFGEFMTERVGWSPMVIGRDQTRLWDFGGGRE